MQAAAGGTSAQRRSVGLNLPRRNTRYRFSMVALADALFQLLIFFMLTSNVAPYAMLGLRSGALQGPAGSGTVDPLGVATTEAGVTAVWTLRPEGLVTAGQQFDLDAMPSLADALIAQGTDSVLVVVRPGVVVQQITTVMEALAARGITSVQLAGDAAR